MYNCWCSVLPKEEVEFDDLQIQLALAFGSNCEIKEEPEGQEEEEEECPAEPDEAHPAPSRKKKPSKQKKPRRQLTRREALQKFCAVVLWPFKSPSNAFDFKVYKF